MACLTEVFCQSSNPEFPADDQGDSTLGRPATTMCRTPVGASESEELAGGVVGVDFNAGDAAAPASPTNWNLADFSTRPAGSLTLDQNNLIDELGQATNVGLAITSSVGGGDGNSQALPAAEAIAAARIPTRNAGEPSLEDLGGRQFVNGADQTIRATWNNLAPFTRYDVYVFGLASDGWNASQSVDINDD